MLRRDEGRIELRPLERGTVTISIEGTAPLIMHRFGEKARKMMLDRQQGRAVPRREPKDPARDFEEAKHLLPDGRLGVPAAAFKHAIVGAARLFDGVTMEKLRIAVRVQGEGPDQLVPVAGECVMREDVVRVGSGLSKVADLRYRPMIEEWSAELVIDYIRSQLTLETLVALVNGAGMGGVGEWRPGRSAAGSFGTFQVVES